MKILALDAALGFFSVALDLEGTVTAERSDRHDALERGLESVARLLNAAGLELADLDRLAVGIGPGSFTGVRIAVSFAKALAFGAGLPVVGISSYDTLTPPDAVLPCLTVVAGRRGVICARLLCSESRVSAACGAVDAVLDRLLAGRPPGTLLHVVSNTEDGVPDIGERHLTVHLLNSPATANPAVAIARLARGRRPDASPHGLVPDYGELPAVTVPKARTTSVP